MHIDHLLKDLLALLLLYKEINLRLQFIPRNTSVNKAQILRNDLIKENASHRAVLNLRQSSSVRKRL